MLGYFAAPLFNLAERAFNADVVERLEKYSRIFLPQRDGGLLTTMVKCGVPLVEAESLVFKTDLDAMRCADYLVAVLDGAHIDEGVAFEVGFMFALGRPCFGLQTDVRRSLPTGNNPMIGRALKRVCQSEAELVDLVKEHIIEYGGDTMQISMSGDMSYKSRENPSERMASNLL